MPEWSACVPDHQRSSYNLWCAGTVAIVSAGTSDELVAEECRATADAMGCYCFRLADVSVDGLHRILQNMSGLHTHSIFVALPASGFCLLCLGVLNDHSMHAEGTFTCCIVHALQSACT